MRGFARSVALITAFAIATRAIGFVFRIFLSRVLGAELLGVYQIAFSYFTVFVTIIASGLPLIISRKISSMTERQSLTQQPITQQRRAFITSAMVISLVASVIIIALVFILQNPISMLFADSRSTPILLILIPSVFAYSIYTVLRAVWWGEKKFFLLGLTELTEQVVRVLLFLFLLCISFVFTDFAVMAALSFTLGIVLTAIIVVVMYIKKHPKQTQYPTNSIPSTASPYYRYLLKSATPITTVRVITTIAMPIIATLLPMRLITAGWEPNQAIAHFGIAVGMTLPLLSIPQTVISSLSTALVPDLSSAQGRGDTEHIRRQIRSCIKLTLFINFILLPLFMAVGVGIGQFLFANEWAGIYLKQSAWIMVPLSLSLITNAILNSLKQETRAMAHYAVGSIFLFLSVWFLPQFIGVGALIVGMGICMSIASLLNIARIIKTTGGDTGFIKQLFGYLMISVPAVLTGRFFFGLIENIMPLFFSLAIGAGLTMAVFLALAWIFKLIELEQFKIRLRKKANTNSTTNGC